MSVLKDLGPDISRVWYGDKLVYDNTSRVNDFLRSLDALADEMTPAVKDAFRALADELKRVGPLTP